MHFQEAVYRNVDTSDMKNKEDETNYYNLVPYPERETDQECIYDVITEQRQLKKPTSNGSQLSRKTKQPVANTKLPTNNSSNTEIKPRFEETKKLSPFVSNMTTIFNKPFVKPQLREIKPPIVNKSYQWSIFVTWVRFGYKIDSVINMKNIPFNSRDFSIIIKKILDDLEGSKTLLWYWIKLKA